MIQTNNMEPLGEKPQLPRDNPQDLSQGFLPHNERLQSSEGFRPGIGSDIKLPEKFSRPDLPVSTSPLKNLLDGRESISAYELKQFFKNPSNRLAIKKELGISLKNNQKLDEEIQDIQNMIINRFGSGVIDQGEIRSSIKKETRKLAQESLKPYEDQSWKKGRWERIIEKKELGLLKKLFGWGKKY
jgi:hypothetical protein